MAVKSKTAKSYVSVWAALLFFVFLIIISVVFAALYTVQETVKGLGIFLVKGEIGQVISPTDATVVRWLVEESDEVNTQEKVVILRPFDESRGEIYVSATRNGHIAEIIAYPGTPVSIGESLALITAPGDKRKELEIVGFVSSLAGKKIKPGMKTLVWPSITGIKEGALLATVKRVGKLPTSKAALKSLIKIPSLAKYIRNRIEDEPFLVVLSLVPDENQISGYRWNGPGPTFELDYGIIADFSIIYAQPSLLELLWPSLRKLAGNVS